MNVSATASDRVKDGRANLGEERIGVLIRGGHVLGEMAQPRRGGEPVCQDERAEV